MKHVKMSIVSALGVLVAACGGSETPSAEQSAAAPATPAMASMTPAASQNGRQGKGTGTVTAIDAKAGTITLDHGPIAELSWPAMTMAFKATPAVLAKTKPGDKVEFEVRLTGNGGEVTSLTKQ